MAPPSNTELLYIIFKINHAWATLGGLTVSLGSTANPTVLKPNLVGAYPDTWLNFARTTCLKMWNLCPHQFRHVAQVKGFQYIH
jgi:hypothetical protein